SSRCVYAKARAWNGLRWPSTCCNPPREPRTEQPIAITLRQPRAFAASMLRMEHTIGPAAYLSLSARRQESHEHGGILPMREIAALRSKLREINIEYSRFLRKG